MPVNIPNYIFHDGQTVRYALTHGQGEITVSAEINATIQTRETFWPYMVTQLAALGVETTAGECWRHFA